MLGRGFEPVDAVGVGSNRERSLIAYEVPLILAKRRRVIPRWRMRGGVSDDRNRGTSGVSFAEKSAATPIRCAMECHLISAAACGGSVGSRHALDHKWPTVRSNPVNAYSRDPCTYPRSPSRKYVIQNSYESRLTGAVVADNDVEAWRKPQYGRLDRARRRRRGYGAEPLDAVDSHASNPLVTMSRGRGTYRL